MVQFLLYPPRLYMKSNKNPFTLKLMVWILFILSIGFIVMIIRNRSTQIISPLSNSNQTIFTYLTNLVKPKKDPVELKRKIENIVGNTWKNYSVYVKDMNSGFDMGIGEEVMYTAASVNKVPILAALYYENQKGDVDMNKVVTLQADDIQSYGTGIIQYDPPGTTYTVKTLARLMMEKSDNTAAYLLAHQILSMNQIQNLMNNWGLDQTDMVNNLTSNKDMGNLFEKIYHGKIANRGQTLEMLSFLKNSDFEDRIPALLPKNTTVYHKIGNGPGFVHDVGIIDGPKSNYYIGILTSDITDDIEATKTAALISKSVFDYMN
jgi:beta-lactamase class A